MNTILIVDDEPAILTSLYFAFEDSFNVHTTTNPDDTMKTLRENEVDMVLLDQRLDQYSGLDLLKAIKKDYPSVMVIAMTAYGSIQSSVEAMTLGAYYYVTKPIDIPGLKILIHKALDYRILHDKVEDLTKRIEQIKESGSIVTNSESMYKTIRLIDKIKDLDINVLITGESGTGKEVIAKHIHNESIRSKGPIEVINCAAIPNSLLESELFGYEKGAFTGANIRYMGKIERSHGGTLFLDEIGDMDLQLQAKLLRVVQDKKITPLGGTSQIPVDFRLISATNRELEEDSKVGRFREDLYFRLNEVSILLPPLRKRREDIPVLVNHFTNKYTALYGREITGFSREAIGALETYDWPGNVRELENVVKRAVAVCEGQRIELHDLPVSITGSKDSKSCGCESSSESVNDRTITVEYGEKIEDVVKKLIIYTLKEAGNNKRKTAQILGMSERQLHNKLKQYSVEKSNQNI